MVEDGRSKDERHSRARQVRKSRAADCVPRGGWFDPFSKAVLLVLSICSRQTRRRSVSIDSGKYAPHEVPMMAEHQPVACATGHW